MYFHNTKVSQKLFLSLIAYKADISEKSHLDLHCFLNSDYGFPVKKWTN